MSIHAGPLSHRNRKSQPRLAMLVVVVLAVVWLLVAAWAEPLVAVAAAVVVS